MSEKIMIGGRELVGELCTCGHLKIQHTAVQFSERNVERDPEHGGIIERRIEEDTQFTMPGHGGCSCCPCPKFTWKEFVFKDE